MTLDEIRIADETICKNIRLIRFCDRGFISQNILSQLRNFVETIAVAVLANKQKNISSRNYQDIQDSLKLIQTKGQYKNLRVFHEFLQKSVSHYIVNEDSSERLMLKYYEHLLKLKEFVKTEFDLNILNNITDFPLNLDPQLSEYYEKIAYKIDRFSGNSSLGERYYIHRIKPFFVNYKIYYEVSFFIATNNTSKFERVIAFTNIDIMPNYAVKLSLHKTKIDVLNRKMDIWIINDWAISIRQCEFKNFAKILNQEINGNSKEEHSLMNYLQHEKINLVELVNASDNHYNNIKMHLVGSNPTNQFFSVLERCRELVKNTQNGCNIIQYLLYRMNNRIIKAQYNKNDTCSALSDLSLKYGCIPFDQMPFASSPIGHNPHLSDLLDCFSIEKREHEFFARKITQNNEIERILFSDASNFKHIENIDSLILDFNSRLYQKTEPQRNRALYKFYNHIYIKNYVDACVYILNEIQKLTKNGLTNYNNSMTIWLNNLANPIDCEEKKTILKSLFIDSNVALIYGAAGTGKSTLISYISNYFSDHNKVFLTNTNTAKSNLERRIKTEKCTYLTVSKFLKNPIKTDVLFIDEASTISNRDMQNTLQLAEFKLLILVGDNYQIESIRFGNWFNIIRAFIPDSAVHELKTPYRTTNSNLLNLWNKVRELDTSILESLVVRETDSYSQKLDETIFDITESDEIILCLNYDGLYGINNINRLLQESNTNKSIQWGINTYKVGDPVLFNDTSNFSSVIYNNLKGTIIDFGEEKPLVWFIIEIDAVLDESSFWGIEGLEFMGISSTGNAIVKFFVESIINTDEDDLYNKKTMPFQIAYAISIHKAQGLEYNSVKVVINNEIDEAVTHNIFYTAITRAKNKLKIYWSAESEKKIIESFKINDYKKDVMFLEKYISQKT